MSLWIKICANTSLEDAQLAAEAGADAVGFVFAPSPRHVTLAQAAAIAPHLPAALEKIGVFVDAAFDEIASTVEACGLTGVQLHFDAGPQLPAELRARFGPGLRILRVVHFDSLQFGEEIGSASGRNAGRGENEFKREEALAFEACFSDPHIDAVLVDSRTATAVGGTGKAFDWPAARRTLFQDAKACKRMVAAGGLNPGNVAEAIATLRPWGVDVVSGVEAAPGRKDPEKVRAFIANARAARGGRFF
jgi:phosphoribosylanthranilate isomerase